jgi:hypothetical protein
MSRKDVISSANEPERCYEPYSMYLILRYPTLYDRMVLRYPTLYDRMVLKFKVMFKY